jgi:speckle-type POZ protein
LKFDFSSSVLFIFRSDVFKAMFVSEYAIENTMNTVEVNDFEPGTLRDFLDFLYSDKLEDPASFSVDLLLLADKYNVEGLRKSCEKALIKSIDNSNALRFLSTVSRIQAPLLVERTANYIFKNLDNLEGTSDWGKLVKSNPEALALIFKHRKA